MNEEALRLLDELADDATAMASNAISGEIYARQYREAFNATLDKLRALLSASDDVPDGWRTMESAPRDGRLIEACRFDGIGIVWISLAIWRSSGGRRSPSGWAAPNDDRDTYLDRPTHWRFSTPPKGETK